MKVNPAVIRESTNAPDRIGGAAASRADRAAFPHDAVAMQPARQGGVLIPPVAREAGFDIQLANPDMPLPAPESAGHEVYTTILRSRIQIEGPVAAIDLEA